MTPLTEIEESQLRNLLARFREQAPDTFINIVLDTARARVAEDSIFILTQRDSSHIPVLALVIAKGGVCALHTLKAVAELKGDYKHHNYDPDAPAQEVQQ